mmetsp:Transcript_25317/g.60851  ORF Transcript_25317/g.60851 Transcript_25317/m.60851 type:complete len:228 (-) Transcript_25317:44-727(-)
MVNLEHVVVQGGGQRLDSPHVIGASLRDQAARRPHGQPSIGDLLRPEPLRLLGISLHVSQRIQPEVPRRPIAALPPARGRDAAHGLDERDHHEGRGDVLRMAVPELPERVGLALGRGGLASRRGSEELDLEEARYGEHGDAAVLELGLAEPVEVYADVVDVGQAEGVEANVSGHGAVEERRPVQEGEGSALLGIEGDGRASRWGRGEGGGRSGEEGEGKLHHGCDLG